MPRREASLAQPTTEWYMRCASRLLNLAPQMSPLEAVRRAMEEFPDSRYQDPRQVADSLFVSASSPAPTKTLATSRS